LKRKTQNPKNINFTIFNVVFGVAQKRELIFMYNLQLIENRIMSIAKVMGLSKNKLLINTNLNKSVFDNMKRGQIPSVDKIHTLADYLNCSVDYLLGRTDEPNGQVANTYSGSIAGNTFTGKSSNSLNVTNNSADTSTQTLSKQALELAQIFDNLDLRKQSKILSLVFELETQDTKS